MYFVRVESVGGGGGAAVTATPRFAMWFSVPDVAVSSAVTEFTGALAAADNSTVSGEPGISWKFAGEAVTPDGSPVNCTETVEENPFIGVAVTIVDVVMPAGIETDAGFADREKSAAGGGG